MKFLKFIWLKSLTSVALILWCSGFSYAQFRNFYVEGTGTQLGVIHTTTIGSSRSGLELLRGSEFSATDWRILNDGGEFKIFDGLDNFLTDGDENLRMGQGGTLFLLQGSEANVGSAGGVLLTGDPNSFHIALDQNEILARRGTVASDLLIQAGTSANTILNQSGGNVGIGDNIAPVRLTVNTGADANNVDGGFLLLGRESTTNLVFDNNEILARNGAGPSTLFLQFNTSGEVSIGASPPEATQKLTIADNGFQLKMTNTNDLTNDWFIGASNPGWNIGEGKLIFDDDTNSNDPIIMLDAAQDAVGISSNVIPAGFKLAVDGNVICEEVTVELSGSWPDYVFQKDYDLPDIKTLEESIGKLGHLPGVPSASQIQSEGIVVGKMQTIMMEKIEELTLYIIQLKKENEEMQKRIKQIEEKS